jgi:hypothetical protein
MTNAGFERKSNFSNLKNKESLMKLHDKRWFWKKSNFS